MNFVRQNFGACILENPSVSFFIKFLNKESEEVNEQDARVKETGRRHSHARGIVMLNKNAGRLLLLAGAVILAILFSWEAFAADLNIIEVRRNIPLSDDAPVYKDFYINAGAESGLKKNLVVTVIRKMAIRDATGTQTYGEIDIPVGQLKIIATQGRVSVAREYKFISRDDEPMLEQIGMMIGDRLELDGSFIDNKKASAKKSE